ncbi:MAG: amidohydrolase family protein [Nitrospiraceae bacterium]
MRSSIIRLHLSFFLILLATIPVAALRTIEFETTEVTAADVALSPDGQRLIFTMLGHLFRLPVEGGTAEQLTFGPYYDNDPVFSPDGTRVAFVSDRDGSEGNIFVLEMATGQITQLTHEPWAGQPTWTPDGQAIVYLRLVREAVVGVPFFWRSVPALVRQVSLSGAEPETLSTPPRLFRSVFYLPDGRLAWAVIEQKTRFSRSTTRIEAMSPQGRITTLRTLGGYVDRVVASPTGDGLYCRRYVPARWPWTPQPEELLFLPLPDGADRQLIPLSNPRGRRPRFAVAADNKSLYLGETGRLWKIALPSGAREPIAFTARVKLEIQDPVAPPKWALAATGSSAPPRSILHPRLSPDGRRLVFGAAGYLWQQPLNGEPAQRLFAGNAFEFDPAFSPDGQRLAFVRSEYGKQKIRVFNFESRHTRTVASGDFHRQPSWSRDGQRLVFGEFSMEDWAYRVVALNFRDDKKEKLAAAGARSRPHLSADGQLLYFSTNGTLYRLPLKENAKPEPITQLARPLSDALVSPDGKWFAFKRNTEIWIAPLITEPVREEHIRQFSAEGGDTFAFTPDSSALIYAAGNRVWRHPLAGGPSSVARDGERKSNHEREEIPIRLELPRPTPPPVLVRRVRVLDFETGAFGPETSLFIEQGRIRWIGSERGRRLPRETLILDAGGRFAIPGLFDMHVHTGFRQQQQAAMLAYGVTSVRDTGGWLALLNALADRGETTSEPVPRYFYAGDIFRDRGGALQIENEEEAQRYVRRWKDWGAQFIKVHPPISWPLARAVVEEARRLGLPVVGHGTKVEEITKSVTLGYAVLEHTNAPNRLYDDMLQMLALAGTRWDPTLADRGGAALLLRDEPERLADAKLRAFTPEWRIRWAQTASPFKAVGDKALRGSWVEQLAGVRAAHRRHIKLQAGTDAGADPECFPGSSLHWELEHFVQAGLPPLDVIRIATQEAAEAVGAEDELGTIEPGKLADLVLLDANPLEDIKNTQTIWRVIKGGWLFDPEKLRPPESASTTK